MLSRHPTLTRSWLTLHYHTRRVLPQLLTETLELLEADASQRAKEAGEQAAMAGQEREALWATVRELRATVEMSQVRLLLLLIQGWRWQSLDSQIYLGHLWVELLSACVCWMSMPRHASPRCCFA